MVKFNFSVKIGLFDRKKIREKLNMLILRLQYCYPDSTLTLTEEKGLFNSIFNIDGLNFPNTEESNSIVKNWRMGIEKLSK